MFMRYSQKEFEENEREMIALFRQMTWREQVILIGRMKAMIELYKQERFISFPIS